MPTDEKLNDFSVHDMPFSKMVKRHIKNNARRVLERNRKEWEFYSVYQIDPDSLVYYWSEYQIKKNE